VSFSLRPAPVLFSAPKERRVVSLAFCRLLVRGFRRLARCHCYDAGTTAPQRVHCRTRLRMMRNQPSKPLTNDATMTKMEKSPAMTVAAPVPTFCAEADSCASRTAARCSYVSEASSASETVLPEATLLRTGSGTWRATGCREGQRPEGYLQHPSRDTNQLEQIRQLREV
jgi:hypothetical protein